MRRTIDVFNVIINLGFVLGAVYIVIIFNNLPSQLVVTLHGANILTSLYLLLGIGLISIIIGSLKLNQSFSKEVIYVDRIVQENVNAIDKTKFNEGINIIDGINIDVKEILNSNISPDNKINKITSVVCNKLNACQGILFKVFTEDKKEFLRFVSSYAFLKGSAPLEFSLGDGLPGLAAKENRVILMKNVPEGYINIVSGLGKSSHVYVALVPLRFEGSVIGVLELALFNNVSEENLSVLDEISVELGKVLNSIVD